MVVGFVAWNQLVPQPDWLLIIPLLLELYIFMLGVALILATLFVRFRDIGQIWELALQLLFYASPIIYPIGYLPEWARNIAFLNPFTQVLQDIRCADHLPGGRSRPQPLRSGTYGRLIPIGIAFAHLRDWALGSSADEPCFAERV